MAPWAQFPALERLAVAGSGGGAVGLQVWAGRVVDRLRHMHTKVAVHVDGFAGTLFPIGYDGFIHRIFSNAWGVCSIVALTEDARAACEGGTFTTDSFLLATIRRLTDIISLQSSVRPIFTSTIPQMCSSVCSINRMLRQRNSTNSGSCR